MGPVEDKAPVQEVEEGSQRKVVAVDRMDHVVVVERMDQVVVVDRAVVVQMD